MSKRDTESPELQWESTEEAAEETVSEFAGNQTPPGARPGFHLEAARRIEQARERRQLRKAIEDFDDYDV